MPQLISLKNPFTVAQQFFSYFYEKKLYREDDLEVVFHKNKLLLNTTSVNYSNGSLQYRLHQAFSHFGLYHRSFESVLLLGFGFGSALQLFQNHSMSIGAVTGVEKNEKILSLAQQWYRFAPEIELVHQDVSDFLRDSSQQYDLILVDVFEGSKVPDFLLERNTLLDICSRLNKGGRCVMNVINHSDNPISAIRDVFDQKLDLMGEHIFLYKERSND